MGILSRRFSEPFSLSSPPQSILQRLRTSFSTSTGVDVDEHSALRNATVFACRRILGETLACLPRQVQELQKSGRWERVYQHPTSYLLANRPNPHMAGFTYWDMIMGHVCMWGDGYTEIVRNGRGEVVELWPWLPDSTRPLGINSKGEIIYRTAVDGEEFKAKGKDICHVLGPGFDGYRGYSLIRMAAESIGIAFAAEKYTGKWFKDGTQGGLVISTPEHLPEVKDLHALREFLEDEALGSGLQHAHRVRILDNGMTASPLGIKPQDAQLLEQLGHQVKEIARFFRMQLSKLQELERQTHGNYEQQGLEFKSDTIQPWVTRIEQEFSHKLYSENEQGKFRLRFNMDALTRGDLKSRAEYYHKACGGPWLRVNEVRDKEDEAPVNGGDELRSPVNMAPMGEEPEERLDV